MIAAVPADDLHIREHRWGMNVSVLDESHRAREAAPHRRMRLDNGSHRWLIPALLIVVAVTTVALHVHIYTKVGPIDELQHIDYLYKSPALVAPGDRIGQDAMREEACRGLDYPGFPLPACSTGTVYRPGDFQEKGYNTASANTPLYYSITHGLATVLLRVTGMTSLVTAGRAVGGLWLGVGLLMTYFAGQRLGAGRWQLAALLIVIACAPAVVYPSATITPDAATFAVGAAVLWVALWWEKRPQRRWPMIVIVTALALAMKMTNIVVIGAIGLYMLLRLIQLHLPRQNDSEDVAPDESPAGRSWIIGGTALASSALVVTLGWLAVQHALTHGDLSDIPMNQQFTATTLVVSPLVGNLGNWITPLSNAWASVGNPELTTVLQRLGQLLIAAGLIATALFGERSLRIRTMAWACLATAFVGASVFIVASFYAQSVYVPPPARYGYTLVPMMVALTATCIRTRTATAIMVLIAAGTLTLSFARLA
ncbi:hypothetical protein DDP54_02805 [Cellulomonas sp. WB94]|uniref:DUF2142 domain-containing protein n=1 Tax=Cellulomonas sp. WB94 TaxID=2173174 RepID=UPI000D588499|nr:DUF2142 domain-containing protein [Cellulomonas sp. WB94]PVU82114.1 hypothetical protein DDP54_02805 [Cellulomonas sp. WB94]